MSMSGAGASLARAGAAGAVLWFCMRANILLPAAAALLGLSASAPGAEQQLSWRDIESRIQYGYYTEDAAALQSLVGLIAADESRDRLHGYYAALLDWRRAELVARAYCGDTLSPGNWPPEPHGASAGPLAGQQDQQPHPQVSDPVIPGPRRLAAIVPGGRW